MPPHGTYLSGTEASTLSISDNTRPSLRKISRQRSVPSGLISNSEDSKAMNEFRDIITADRTSHRSSYVTGRLHSSRNSRYALERSQEESSQETDPDLIAWKSYCIAAARKFKSEGKANTILRG